jgi:NAD(P)-dependent dehydrogenase (short-subunit alcohol dehydrogenase family)
VLVTGGGRAIGRSIALACAAEGARVLAVARTRAELDEVQRVAGKAVAIALADVTDRSQVERLPELASAELGGLDVLVNNAGTWMEKPFLEFTRADWDRTLATNLTALFDVTQLLLPLLLRSPDARVINIAAIDGEVGFAKLVPQCAAKFGAVGFTKALAKELWDEPITVNAICPAAVDKGVGFEVTPVRTPAPETALPWDVARAVVYLASQDGVRITGSCLDVHGVGFLAS